ARHACVSRVRAMCRWTSSRDVPDPSVTVTPLCHDGAMFAIEVIAEVERLGAAAKVLFARRADETNGWRRVSRATSREQWLPRVSWCSGAAAGAPRGAAPAA